MSKPQFEHLMKMTLALSLVANRAEDLRFKIEHAKERGDSLADWDREEYPHEWVMFCDALDELEDVAKELDGAYP